MKEVLFSDDAVSPDSSSQTAYVIQHASIGLFPFSLVFASSNLLLYSSHPLCDIFFFCVNFCFLFAFFCLSICFYHSFLFCLSLPLCVSVYTVNASLVLYSHGKKTNPQIVTSNSFFFPHSPDSQCRGLCCIIALVLSG